MFHITQGNQKDLTGKLLIVASVCIGDVATLTLDRIIIANHFKRIGYLLSQFIEPSVGYLPKEVENGSLGLPAELYLLDNVLLLQLRSSIRFARKKDFAKQLSDLCCKHSLQHVILLTSLPLSLRPDRQIQSCNRGIYYHLKGTLPQQIELNSSTECSLIIPLSALKDEDEQMSTLLKSAGLAEAMMKHISNLLILLVFSEEMEDRQLVMHFLKGISKLLASKQLSGSS